MDLNHTIDQFYPSPDKHNQFLIVTLAEYQIGFERSQA